MKDIKWLKNLKYKLSWGVLGNQVPLFSVMAMKRSVSSDFLIFAGHKDSSQGGIALC
jgi:hypothetical protein